MLVLGALSGTSINAKEFLLCDIKSEDKIKPLEYFSEKYSEDEKKILIDLTLNGGNTEKISYAHDIIGLSFSKTLKRFLNEISKLPETTGFHGQTIFHKEISGKKIKALTLQIGEPCFLSIVSRRPVVYDFRKSDISAGGKGAPLSPLIHYILFRKYGKKVCVVNLGGISNISIIEGEEFHKVRGYDIGPANALSDFIAKQKLKKEFDPEGKYAKKGKIIESVFQKIYRIFQKRKNSLGVEVEEAKKISYDILKNEKVENALRTVTEVSIKLISSELNKIKPSVAILCGGGVRNLFFVDRIKEESKTPIVISDELGIKSEYIEPILFAFLAYLRMKNKRIDMKNITGSKISYLPGKICFM